MKKSILGGLFVFAFTFIALFLALDNKPETYAYVIANCPSPENIKINIEQIESKDIWQVSVDSDMSEDCCRDTLGWENYSNDGHSSVCSTTLKNIDSAYYYNSPNAGYCEESFTYDPNKMRCENKIASLKYSCGSVNCTFLPSTLNAPKSIGGSTTLNISSIEPQATNYVFLYWTNSSETKKYKSDCTGLNNCKTNISINNSDTLHAKWRKVELAQEEEIVNSSNNVLLKTMVILIALFILTFIGYFSFTIFKNKKNKKVENNNEVVKN